MASGLHEYSTFSARLTLAVSAALLTFGVALMPVHDALAAKPKVRNAEDLLIVDCLLPGQVRKLGAMANYMSARRPIRTTQADCEIRGGEYVAFDRANYQTALKVWMDQANAGSADAQNYVGEIYLKGLGTAPDYDMAAVWLKKAVAQGNNRARINLGYLYEQGLGVEKDLTRALNLYREASGIQDDDLLFASTVQVQLEAKDAEIGSLREDVATSEAESQRLRRQVDELQGQLRSRKQALQGAQRELQATQSKLAEARKATGADFSAIDRQRSVLNERENEVARLTAALKAEREASERRRAEVEQQLAELKSREDAARTAGAQQTLAQIREETDQLTASLDDARQRAENVQTQLASNQSQLEIERQQYEARIAQLEAEAAGRKQEDWELMKLLETQLAARESEVRQQQTQIAVLEQQTALAGGSLLAAAPTLEIIDPPLAVTRGRPAAMLQRSAGRQDLTGKVSNPQAIASITVNGTPVVLGGNGLFRASIDVQPGGSVVKVAATDRRGGSGELEFLMVPQADGAAASRAPTPAPAATAGVPAGVDLGRYHAIVIGNNSYVNSHFQPLQSAVNDATAVAEMLRNRYGFKTNLLLNASRFEILSALNDARETLGPNDNLLVYYAGHGELSADGEQGYWIPVDGQPEVAGTWISNSAISSILETMKAKQVLVVADSCYSGAMTRASVPTFNAGVMAPDKWNAWVKNMASSRARTALTSGGVQPVPDSGSGKHSYFARAFLNALEDNNRLLEAQRLYRDITVSLALASVDAPVTQVPEYSPIRFAGHESGDFFFLPKQTAGSVGP
ncbi:MAG: caspase family protein [Lysobacteraceae bacterium]